MVYRELRETCSKLGEEMFSKSAEAGSKGTNYFSCHKDFTFLKVCRNTRCAFFFSLTIKIGSFF